MRIFPSSRSRKFSNFPSLLWTQPCGSGCAALESPFAPKSDGMGVFAALPRFRGQWAARSGLNDPQRVLDRV